MPEPAKKTAAKKTAAPRPNLQPFTPEEKEAALWARLTEPFPEDWVEKLPKVLSREDRDKGRCSEHSRYSADGHYCNGYHSRAVHLDYVGHAGITMRLNDVLGPGGWDFQPMTHGPDGLPFITRDAFWAQLTILGVTKWELATNYNGPQEALGDALRRCAMRFGIGTYLWSKSDHAFNLAKAAEPDPEPEVKPIGRGDAPRQEPTRPPDPEHVTRLLHAVQALPEDQKTILATWWEQEASQGNLPPRANMAALLPAQAAWVLEVIQGIKDRAEAEAQASQDQPLPETQEPAQDPR